MWHQNVKKISEISSRNTENNVLRSRIVFYFSYKETGENVFSEIFYEYFWMSKKITKNL